MKNVEVAEIDLVLLRTKHPFLYPPGGLRRPVRLYVRPNLTSRNLS
jgi:hypothetical protein